MTVKKIITILAIGLFTISTMQAQEKKQEEKMVKHDSLKMKHESMKMDHNKMNHNNMEMNHHKMKTMHDKMDMKQEKMSKSYTCSMHPEVVSGQPGKCPKCGMELMEKKMEMNKKEEHNEENNTKKHNH